MIKVNNKFVGTKGYAAPELIIDTDKEKVVDGRKIDIWALGITLLELLERRHPFSVKTVEELHKYLSKDIALNEEYPPELKDLLRKMLRLKNEERVTIVEVGKHPWVVGKQK